MNFFIIILYYCVLHGVFCMWLHWSPVPFQSTVLWMRVWRQTAAEET